MIKKDNPFLGPLIQWDPIIIHPSNGKPFEKTSICFVNLILPPSSWPTPPGIANSLMIRFYDQPQLVSLLMKAGLPKRPNVSEAASTSGVFSS